MPQGIQYSIIHRQHRQTAHAAQILTASSGYKHKHHYKHKHQRQHVSKQNAAESKRGRKHYPHILPHLKILPRLRYSLHAHLLAVGVAKTLSLTCAAGLAYEYFGCYLAFCYLHNPSVVGDAIVVHTMMCVSLQSTKLNNCYKKRNFFDEWDNFFDKMAVKESDY